MAAGGGIGLFEHSAGAPFPYGSLPQRLWDDGVDALRHLIEAGGPVVAVLIGLSVLAVAIILLKGSQFALRGVGRHGRPERAMRAWTGGDRERGYELARSARSPVAIALAHAMRGISKVGPRDALMREDVERVSLAELQNLRGFLGLLDRLGQIAPLLGLFGTIVGLINTFNQMQVTGPVVDPSIFAAGMWASFLATALGLAIAIVAAAASSWFDTRIDNERATIERLVTAVFTDRVTDEIDATRLIKPTAIAASHAP
jgi:biopolymer transport protein ExbB